MTWRQSLAAEDVPGWQWTVALLGLITLGDPWININKTFGGDDPAPWIRWLWVTFYALFLPLLVANLGVIARAAMRTPLLSILAVAALASALWSILPDVSFRRAIGVMYWLAFAYVIASRFSWGQIIKMIALAYLALSIGSYVFGVVWPQHGIMDTEHVGAWSGVWTHKNQTGGHMTVAFLASLSAAWLFPAQRRLFLFAAVLALGLVILSRSATALVSSTMVLGVFGFILLVRSGVVIAVLAAGAALIVVLGIGGILLLAPEILFGAIGRDMTFTGRTDIWHYLITAIQQEPWLGYGYGAFWEDPTGPAWWVRAGVGWKAPSSHNGWMELTLGLGLLGAGVFATVFLIAVWRGLVSITHPQAGVFVPAFLCIFAIQTFGEGSVLEDNNLIWSIFTIVAAKLALDVAQRHTISGENT